MTTMTAKERAAKTSQLRSDLLDMGYSVSSAIGELTDEGKNREISIFYAGQEMYVIVHMLDEGRPPVRYKAFFPGSEVGWMGFAEVVGMAPNDEIKADVRFRKIP